MGYSEFHEMLLCGAVVMEAILNRFWNRVK
ncbi:hypothetical protein BDI4_660055 [Burkholderia diffusa]|nr:hypothetical protein BDI4_660055 [Burkholderia diffusa]